MKQKIFLSSYPTTSPFFYIIRDKAHNMFYAGYCSNKYRCDSSTFMTERGYKTSSVVIKRIINKRGLNDFEVVRIRHFGTRLEATKYEHLFLTKVKANINPKFYNQTTGYISTAIAQEKYSTARVGRKTPDYVIQKISKAKAGRDYVDLHGPEKAKKLKEMARERRLGTTHNNETKQKISQALKAHKRTPEHTAKIAEALTGRPTSEELRRKRSAYMRGRKWWNNGVMESCSHDSPGEGWVRGRINTSQGRAWWNNGYEQKMSVKDPGEGWVKGKLQDHFLES